MGSVIERPIRDALRLLAPGPVVLLSSMRHRQPNLMTAAWVAPQSLAPTLLSVAIHPDRLTHEFVSATEEFVINFPVFESLRVVHEAGMLSGRDGDKFMALGIEPVDAELVEPPRIPNCAAYIECRVVDRVTSGDHDRFFAEVVHVAADDESFDGFWDVASDAGRLVHHLGAARYAGLSEPYQVSPPEED